jgi:hypothetical protein
MLWKTSNIKESEIFVWFVIVLAIALYCNLGWAYGYVLSNPENVPHWLSFLADPFLITTDAKIVYVFGMQVLFVICGPIFWAMEWIIYVTVLCLGGIAKLLIMS